MDRVRILIADDHALMRDALRALFELQPDLEVVGFAADGEAAIEAAARLTPDVVLLDVRMPGLSGIEAAPLIRASAPSARILAVSGNEDGHSMERMRDAGADAYVAKSVSAEEMIAAVRACAASRR